MNTRVNTPWTSISFCHDLARQIAPKRVLDISMGSGCWSLIFYESMQVADRKGASQTSSIIVEGLTENLQSVKSIDRQLYYRIHEMPLDQFMSNVPARYDLIVGAIGTSHKSQQDFLGIFRKCLQATDYLILHANLELCSDPNGLNAQNWPLIHQQIFHTAQCPYAVLILSCRDPLKLHQKLQKRDNATPPNALSNELLDRMRTITRQIRERNYELNYIKQHTAFLFSMRLIGTPFWRMLRYWKNKNRNLVTIRVLGKKNEDAAGQEVWLLAARHAVNSMAVPWEFMERRSGEWYLKDAVLCPYQKCYMSKQPAVLQFPLMSEDPIVDFMSHPYSGIVEIEYKGRRKRLDLYSAHGENRRVFIGRDQMTDISITCCQEHNPINECLHHSLRTDQLKGGGRDERTRPEWLDSVTGKDIPVLAIHTPRWLGITNSTRVLFEHTYPFPYSPSIEPYQVSDATIEQEAQTLLNSGIKHFVFSGGDEIHFKLVCELKKGDPSIRCDLLWHGAYVRFLNDYEWKLVKLWVTGARHGLIHTVGTVKKGMEKFFRSLGVRSEFVMNYIPQIPHEASIPDAGGPHLGLWMSGFNPLKSPYTMISAVRMIKGGTLHGSNFDLRAIDVLNFFGLSCERVTIEPLTKEQLYERIKQTHLSLYVTFTECCPMLPLESLSLGVPCLVGPTSHLFEDDEYLRSRLVVPYPDRAEIIAGYIERAVSERKQIVDAYISYARDYNERALKSIEDFIA